MAQELPSPLACVPSNPGVVATQMLDKVYGSSSLAQLHGRSVEEWVESAGPFILSLNRQHNGKSLTIP